MSSEILTRWPVRLSLPLDVADRDENGQLTDAGVDRLFGIARAAYFERCRTFDGTAAEVGPMTIQRRGVAVAGTHITISAAATEVFPESFTMTARIRPSEGDGVVADARCAVSLGGGVTKTIRDELIALAHAASHWH